MGFKEKPKKTTTNILNLKADKRCESVCANILYNNHNKFMGWHHYIEQRR
jgi:hypothetical protein